MPEIQNVLQVCKTLDLQSARYIGSSRVCCWLLSRLMLARNLLKSWPMAMDFLAGKSVANYFITCSDHDCCQIRKTHVEMILIVHESGRTSRKFHALFIFVFITTPFRCSLELLLDKLKFRDFKRFTRCHLKPYRDHLLLDGQPWSCQPEFPSNDAQMNNQGHLHQHEKRLHKSRWSLCRPRISCESKILFFYA